MLIGILSDTHGLLRQEVSFALLEISGSGQFEFGKRVIDNSGQDSRLPKDIDRIISKARALPQVAPEK